MTTKGSMQRCSSCAYWFHENCANIIFKKVIFFYCITCKEMASQTETLTKLVAITREKVSRNNEIKHDDQKSKINSH